MTLTTRSLAACATLLWACAALATPTTQQKCEQAKLKAQGKYQLCMKKNAGDVRIGKGDNSMACSTKFAAALQKADNKAAALMASCRYVDNGDGTVSDLNTGLIWEKKDDLGGVHDKDNNYPWASSGATPDGAAFTEFLGTLNGGTSSDGTAVVTACFTGHCDWRLPTIQELKGIVDLTQGACGGGSGACIDPAFGSTQDDVYWSDTSHSSNSILAWDVYFGNGNTGYSTKTLSDYVRAVRGGL